MRWEDFLKTTFVLADPLATLEEVLVPLYLLHRFQVQAVGKIVGGQNFTYALRGDGQIPVTAIDGRNGSVQLSTHCSTR